MKTYVIGRAPDFGREPFRYTCFKCGHYTMLEAMRWNQLPELSWAELRNHDEFWRVESDLRGHGISEGQISELEAAGVTTEEILPRRGHTPAFEPGSTRRAAGGRD